MTLVSVSQARLPEVVGKDPPRPVQKERLLHVLKCLLITSHLTDFVDEEIFADLVQPYKGECYSLIFFAFFDF